MYKKILLCISVIYLCLGITGCSFFKKNKNDISNDNAVVEKEKRTVTIVNKTNEIINEFHLYVNQGTELVEYQKNNIENNSFSMELKTDLDEYDQFSFTLIDRYGIKYEKKDVAVSNTGNTEIVIEKSDEVKESGNFWKKVDRFFNN